MAPDDEHETHEEEVATKRWQIYYKDGGGQQVSHASEEEARKWAMEFWGDREIASIHELV